MSDWLGVGIPPPVIGLIIAASIASVSWVFTGLALGLFEKPKRRRKHHAKNQYS